MSTTLLYHAFNIRGYSYRSMKPVPGGVEITIEQAKERCSCPACGSDNILLKGS